MFFFLKINHCGMYKIAYLCKPVAVKVMNDKVSLFFHCCSLITKNCIFSYVYVCLGWIEYMTMQYVTVNSLQCECVCCRVILGECSLVDII